MFTIRFGQHTYVNVWSPIGKVSSDVRRTEVSVFVIRIEWYSPPPFAENVFWRIPHPTLSIFHYFGHLNFANFAIVGPFGPLPVTDQFWRDLCDGFPHKQSFVVAISIKRFCSQVSASEDVKVTTIYLISQDHVNECSNVVSSLIKR